MKRQSGRLFRDVHFSLKSLTILEFVDSEKATRSGWLVLFVLSSPPPAPPSRQFSVGFLYQTSTESVLHCGKLATYLLVQPIYALDSWLLCTYPALGF